MQYLVVALLIGLVLPTFALAQTRIQARRNAIVLSTWRGVASYPKPTLQLDVPFHHQEHSLSCEAAALRMLLLYNGIDEPENWILQKMPFGPVGADPSKVFVGDIDGSQPTTGYGIHWDGLAEVAKAYGTSEAFSDKYLYYLIDRLHDGHPVIIWGSVFKNPKDISWVTPEGKTVKALNGEHVWVVTGYAGPREAPTYIFTLDPLRGVQVFRTGDFMAIWDDFGTSGMLLTSLNHSDPTE